MSPSNRVSQWNKVNVWQVAFQRKKCWFVAFADFYGVSTSTLVNFRLLTRHHWTWSLEVCMVAHCYKASLPYRGDVAVVQPLNHIWLFAILWTAAHLASQSLTISQSSPKFTESVMPSREGGMVRHCSEVTQANIVKRINNSKTFK